MDTNVIIQALLPHAQHHETFRVLIKACNELGIPVRVCQISLDELRRVYRHERNLFERVREQIPRTTAPKVRSFLCQVDDDTTTSASLEDSLADFERPSDALKERYGISRIDDRWFVEADSNSEVQGLCHRVEAASGSRRRRPKRPAAVLHDAMLLHWMMMEREEGRSQPFLITLDTSLTRLEGFSEGTCGSTPVVTLDALLQWIAPIVLHDGEQTDVASVFAEAVRYQLLPQSNFFELNDFVVFQEMSWECRNLPAEDVENCIGYYKSRLGNCDPSDPRARESMAYHVRKYFTDPTRKYKSELQRLENKNKDQAIGFEAELARNQRSLEQKDGTLNDLKAQNIRLMLIHSAGVRAGLAGLLALFLQTGVAALASYFATGANLFQKYLTAWPYATACFACSVLFFCWFLDKERVQALGWPFTRLL